MILAAEAAVAGGVYAAVVSVVIFVATAGAIVLGFAPMKALVLHQQQRYGTILRSNLLIDVHPRMVTVLSAVAMTVAAMFGYAITRSLWGVLVGLVVGAFAPAVVIRYLSRRRLNRLEGQLVAGVQTLASGVRAGLNLVQSLKLVARDGPIPLKQEFAHLLREYDYGVPLEEAMNNAATRIGSGDFRLLFSALQTHRERGGDLGLTLDRIADSIREIQRLENRVKTLTAQGRATARWLGVMPLVLLGMYYFIDSSGVRELFVDDLGKLLLFAVVVLNGAGFLWVKKVVSIDI